MSFKLAHYATSANEYSWGNCIYPHALFNPSTRKYYLPTVKKATKKAYLLEIDRSGNIRELELQMPIYPDTTYGNGDCHCIPALIWLDRTFRKIVAVGGEHVGGTFRIEVVDVEAWSSEKVIDSGIDGTYHILIRKSSGEIIIFYRNNSNGHLYYVKYDPSTDTVSTPVQVTTYSGDSSRAMHLGYDFDKSLYMISVTPNWSDWYTFYFDAENEKFYDLNENELTPPFDPTTLPTHFDGYRFPITKYNGYIYGIFQTDIDNDGNRELILAKMDISGSIVDYEILVDDMDITNYWPGAYDGYVFLSENQLYGIYTAAKTVKAIKFDVNLNITELASITLDIAALRLRPIYIDVYNNTIEDCGAAATGEDDHDQSSEINEASNPQNLHVYDLLKLTSLSLQVVPL